MTRSVADHATDLLKELQATGELDAETEMLLHDRVAKAKRLNRVYGWTILRRGEFGRLRRWLGSSRNRRDFLAVLTQKLRGHRGLPH